MIVRLYTGPDGQSHFEDLTLPPPGAEDTGLLKVTGLTFRRSPTGRFIDWHNAPRRQYIITLAGAVEIGIGDGSVRRFGQGDVLLAEDLTGHGHTSRNVGEQERRTAIMPLA